MPTKNKQVELFKVRSGKFFGWCVGNEFYSVNGKHAGYFMGDELYSDTGHQIGCLYPQDRRRIGLQNLYGLNSSGDRGTTTESVDFKIPADLPENDDNAWSDPK